MSIKEICFFAALLSLSLPAIAQVIDAEAYIKKNGAQKKVRSGDEGGVFHMTAVRMSLDDLKPYMEAVKGMPRTEEAKALCLSSAAGLRKVLVESGRNALSVRHSVGYGGPMEQKYGCILFIEQNGAVASVRIDFMKIVPRSGGYDTYTVSLIP